MIPTGKPYRLVYGNKEKLRSYYGFVMFSMNPSFYMHSAMFYTIENISDINGIKTVIVTYVAEATDRNEEVLDLGDEFSINWSSDGGSVLTTTFLTSITENNLQVRYTYPSGNSAYCYISYKIDFVEGKFLGSDRDRSVYLN